MFTIGLTTAFLQPETYQFIAPPSSSIQSARGFESAA
jgi:hypothetical protein